MANSQFPGFVQINYHSDKAPHSMEICTRAYTLGGGGFVSGSFPDWGSDTPREANDMINDLVTELLVFFPATVSFDNYTIFTLADENADPEPRYFDVFVGKTGTSAVGGWYKAVQQSWAFRTTAFGLMKLVLLDADSNDDFDKLTPSGITADVQDVIDELISDNNAWQGRDGAQITGLIQVTKTLNEKLRKAYRMD